DVSANETVLQALQEEFCSSLNVWLIERSGFFPPIASDPLSRIAVLLELGDRNEILPRCKPLLQPRDLVTGQDSAIESFRDDSGLYTHNSFLTKAQHSAS